MLPVQRYNTDSVGNPTAAREDYLVRPWARASSGRLLAVLLTRSCWHRQVSACVVARCCRSPSGAVVLRPCSSAPRTSGKGVGASPPTSVPDESSEHRGLSATRWTRGIGSGGCSGSSGTRTERVDVAVQVSAATDWCCVRCYGRGGDVMRTSPWKPDPGHPDREATDIQGSAQY